jgi:hypothetical protein
MNDQKTILSHYGIGFINHSKVLFITDFHDHKTKL